MAVMLFPGNTERNEKQQLPVRQGAGGCLADPADTAGVELGSGLLVIKPIPRP